MGNKDSKVAAEVLSDPENDKKSLLAGGIVGENIASTAVDSMRDSQETGNELAKKNVMAVLQDKSSIPKFGELLTYSFSYESVLKPTRELLYWSLSSEDSFNNVKYLSKNGINDWVKTTGKNDLIPPISQWILSRDTRLITITPLLTWSLREKTVSLEQLGPVLANSIPYTKASTVENLTWYALEALKSDDVKKIAKDGLVHMLRKTAGKSDDILDEVNTDTKDKT